MSDELVTVGAFADTFQASMARNALEAAGISAFLQGDLSADLFQVGSGIGVRLLVPQRDESEAHRILEEMEAERERSAQNSDDDHDYGEDETESAFSEAPIDPGLMAPEPMEPKEKLSDRAENVGRAFRSMILGLVFPPLMFLSVYFLFLCYGDEEPLEPETRKRLVVTSVITLTVAVAVTLGFLLLCLGVRLSGSR